MTEKVETREALIQHIGQLRSDFDSAPDGWENKNLPSFLEAMSAWLEDCDGFYGVSEVKPSWRVFADILSAARVYE